MSEILSRRINQTQILSDFVIKGLLVIVTLCLVANETCEVLIRLHNDQKESLVTQGYFPLGLFLLEAILIAGSVIRVWLVLRSNDMVSMNEKYMALHAVLVFFMAVGSVLNALPVNKFWYVVFYQVIDFCAALMIAAIMWKVSMRSKEEQPELSERS